MLTDQQLAEVCRLLKVEVPEDFKTGQTTIHWHEGEPVMVDVLKRGRRKGDAKGVGVVSREDVD